MKLPANRGLFWDMGAAILVLMLPLLIFLKHHGYPLVSGEIALLMGLVIPCGLICGLVMNLGGVTGRFVVTVWLAVLVVDIQTTWITTLGLRLLLNILFFSTLFWFLRRRLSQVVLIVAAAMIAGTLVTPAREQVRTRGADLTETAGASDLPFILHLILDEHIGIEGIPRQFDPGGGIAGQVRDPLLDKGFRVFGRAYSSYFATIRSLPNMMNFSNSTDPEAFLSPSSSKGWYLKQNAWFDFLHEQGYWIHVIQPDYLTYDNHTVSASFTGVESSVTYTAESIYALAPVALPPTTKARFILGSYLRLSWFLSMMRDGYGDLRRSSAGQTLGFPAWDLSGKTLSTLSSMNAVQLLRRDLGFAGPGRAFFVHLLLPHFPYAYQRDCGIREVKDAWLDVVDEAHTPHRNDDASRALRYPQYLDQVICTSKTVQGILDELSGRSWWDKAIVVIHGDHGSRIDLLPPFIPFREKFTDQGLMDDFSTLFAIKKPGVPAGYDRRQLPVGHLFQRLVRDGRDPGDPDLESRPRVMISDDTNSLQEIDLPFFDHGLPQASSRGER